MITGTENLLVIAESYPEIISEFSKHGMGSYFKSENLKKIGRYTVLNTLLKSSKIDEVSFIAELNRILGEQKPTAAAELTDLQQQLHLMAMLPCGLRNPFKDFIEKHILENENQYAGLNYLAEGNLNHELSYYPLLDSISSIDELPDIIIASDVNNFFHRPFMEKFVKKGFFESWLPYTPNSYLGKAGYFDPEHNFTMLTANMLVMVVDQKRLGNRPMPEKWDDLLSADFENELIMRGEDDFFCNAVMLPFYKDNGLDAIRILASNIKSGKHPAEMVKLAGSVKEEAAAVYIMPYFFSKRIKDPQVKVVWPKDGAIASPVFLLAKKTALKEHQDLLDFLLSKPTGDLLTGRHFPAVNPESDNSSFPDAVKWLGWDFLTSNDIGALKDNIRATFMQIWTKK